MSKIVVTSPSKIDKENTVNDKQHYLHDCTSPTTANMGMKNSKPTSLKKFNHKPIVFTENQDDPDADWKPEITSPLKPTVPISNTTAYHFGSDPIYLPNPNTISAAEIISTNSSNSLMSTSSHSSYSSQKRGDSNDMYYPQSKTRRIPHPAYPPSFNLALTSDPSIVPTSISAPAVSQNIRTVYNDATSLHIQPSVITPAEVNVTTKSKSKEGLISCTCRKSHCLKLYCACFKHQVYCNPECTCYDCYNNEQHEEEREETILNMKSKNPHCFESNVDKKKGVNRIGCRCKKTHCDKKYCECFNAGVPCGPHCQCHDCRNRGCCHNTN